MKLYCIFLMLQQGALFRSSPPNSRAFSMLFRSCYRRFRTIVIFFDVFSAQLWVSHSYAVPPHCAKRVFQQSWYPHSGQRMGWSAERTELSLGRQLYSCANAYGSRILHCSSETLTGFSSYLILMHGTLPQYTYAWINVLQGFAVH